MCLEVERSDCNHFLKGNKKLVSLLLYPKTLVSKCSEQGSTSSSLINVELFFFPMEDTKTLFNAVKMEIFFFWKGYNVEKIGPFLSSTDLRLFLTFNFS